jgi:ArsR family transcriptional regulator
LPLAQSTVSQHLKELKKVQLIVGEIEGPKSCYCINWETLKEFSEWIRRLFSELKCC